MKTRKNAWSIVILMLAFGMMLVACDSNAEKEEDAGSEGTPAMIDSVTVEEQMAHKYAVVNGNYPDACTRISNVDQEVEGITFKISLSTARPEELACAQMLSPFTVNILLEVGGLAPGEYTVSVNNTATTTFSIGG